ncbi:MAG: hypothetical protein GY928_13915 [Colwellia sp.]|nr:hypothetical protein [Colwellia sp.]
MKKIILILGMLLLPVALYAKDLHLTWDVEPNATGYVIRHSVDLGINWEPYITVPNNLATYTVPDTGIILIQVGAYNVNGRMWRRDSGFFYNGDWKKPNQSNNIGMQ